MLVLDRARHPASAADPRSRARPRVAVVVARLASSSGATANDLNGPFLAARGAARSGLEPVRIRSSATTPTSSSARSRDGLDARPAASSPAVSARPTTTGRSSCSRGPPASALRLDDGLESQIEGVSRAVAERLQPAVRRLRRRAWRSRRRCPKARISLGLAGTAPARRAAGGRRASPSALPGPPRELQRLWPNVRSRPSRCGRCSRAPSAPERRVLRFFGASESAVARALADAGGDGDGVDATICARDFEIHVDLFVDRAPRRAPTRSRRSSSRRWSGTSSARRSGRSRSIVLELCRARGWTLATAESCTGGLVAARLTSCRARATSFLGGVVAYANERQGGASWASRRRCSSEHGAVSAGDGGRDGGGRARAARRGRRGVGDGHRRARTAARAEKPVGLVYIHAERPGGERAASSSTSPATASRSAARDRRRRSISCGGFCHRVVTRRVTTRR